MQGYVALRAGETCEGNAFPAGESVPKALKLVAAKFVGPLVLFPCEVRDCQLHVVSRGPGSNLL